MVIVDTLPAPVRRYLERTRAAGRSGVTRVREREHGVMWLKRGGDPVTFTAEQWFTLAPPAFCWTAKFALGILPLTVVDEFVDGRGRGAVGPFGMKLRTIAGPECDHGELLRWLGSTLLFPMVWLSPALAWEAVDERSARLSLALPGVAPAVLDAAFDDDGTVTFTGLRHRAEGKNNVPHRWLVRGADPRAVDGVGVPHRLEAAWIEDDGSEFLYFRGELDALRFE